MRWPIKSLCLPSKSWRAFPDGPNLPRKLFLSPYGVDLDRFPRARARCHAIRLCCSSDIGPIERVLTSLLKQLRRWMGFDLIHVGALLDVPFPRRLAICSLRSCSPMGTQRFLRSGPCFCSCVPCRKVLASSCVKRLPVDFYSYAPTARVAPISRTCWVSRARIQWYQQGIGKAAPCACRGSA